MNKILFVYKIKMLQAFNYRLSNKKIGLLAIQN